MKKNRMNVENFIYKLYITIIEIAKLTFYLQFFNRHFNIQVLRRIAMISY